MNPCWTNGLSTLYRADARAIPLPDQSVHCVVTSPPYYGLRNYGLTDWEGGDPGCNHSLRPHPELPAGSLTGERPANTNHAEESWPGGVCGRCGARQKQIGVGNEATIQEYIGEIVKVFREVWRVLRDDGTVWVNLGDSYATGKGTAYNPGGGDLGKYRQAHGAHPLDRGNASTLAASGLKPKDLTMVPARVVLALQADGWVVRQRVIWHKTNPMPESVEDRPASATEDIYLLAKSNDALYWSHRDLPGTRREPAPDYRWVDRVNEVEYDQEPPGYSDEMVDCPDCGGVGELEVRAAQISMFNDGPAETVTCPKCNYQNAENPGLIRRWRRVNLWTGHDYFYDAQAVREPIKTGTLNRLSQKTFESRTGGPKDAKTGNRSHRKALENLRRTQHGDAESGWSQVGDGRLEGARQSGSTPWVGLSKAEQQAKGANLRNVWTIATQPYKGSHFATFPEQIPRTCILAGTSQHGVCGECGAPWTRVVEKSFIPSADISLERGIKGAPGQKPMAENNHWDGTPRGSNSVATVGWRPTCECNATVIPATVLDCFAGSGTSLAVAQQLGRRSVGLDLNKEYLDLASKRIGKGPLPVVVAQSEASKKPPLTRSRRGHG